MEKIRTNIVPIHNIAPNKFTDYMSSCLDPVLMPTFRKHCSSLH